MTKARTQPVPERLDHDGPRSLGLRDKRYTIANIIPPRPGARVGTLVFDPKERPPIESVTVRSDWLRATHARIGARISFIDGGWMRYWWEELDPIERRHGIMDELYPRKVNGSSAR